MTQAGRVDRGRTFPIPYLGSVQRAVVVCSVQYAVRIIDDPLLPQSAAIHTTRHNGTVPFPSQFPGQTGQTDQTDHTDPGPHLLPSEQPCRTAVWLDRWADG